METEQTLYQSKDLRLAYGTFEKPDTSRQRLHMHPHCEILFFYRVKGVFHVNGSVYHVEPGDLLLMQPLEAHYMQSAPGSAYDRAVLRFSPELFSSMDPDRSILKPFFDRSPGQRNLYRPAKLGLPGWNTYVQSMLRDSSRNNILITLLNILQQIGRQFSDQHPDAVQQTPEHRIIQYINDHLHEELSSQSLCQRFYISRTQLYQRFMQATGTSVARYISTRRIFKAQQLILQGLKPTEVFTQCGFRDYSTFYRAYVKHFGYSPIEEIGEKLTVSINDISPPL